jgi:hypothetical protein
MPDGSAPKGPVSIQLKECYSEADMIRENLSTLSDGRLLETKGMIHIAAYANGQELKLKAGKEFIIHFPNKEADKPMNLFYGERNDTGGLNWKIDSSSLLSPRASHRGGVVFYDREYGKNFGIFTTGDKPIELYEFFSLKFDNGKLQPQNVLPYDCQVHYRIREKGRLEITDFKVVDTASNELPNVTPDPYLLQFIRQTPLVMRVNEEFVPGETYKGTADGWFEIRFELSPRDYQNNESYNKQFRQKYARFTRDSITTINSTELGFYVFSASKLGWINCDYFWNTDSEKVDFIVKADPDSRPDFKLIFKKVKSIMGGEKEGGNIVFKNIPAGEEVKIVAISFKGNKPFLAIAHTKTSNQIFDKLEFKEFSLNDLEKELNDQ